MSPDFATVTRSGALFVDSISVSLWRLDTARISQIKPSIVDRRLFTANYEPVYGLGSRNGSIQATLIAVTQQYAKIKIIFNFCSSTGREAKKYKSIRLSLPPTLSNFMWTRMREIFKFKIYELVGPGIVCDEQTNTSFPWLILFKRFILSSEMPFNIW